MWKSPGRRVSPSVGKQLPCNSFPTISTDMDATILATIVPAIVLYHRRCWKRNRLPYGRGSAPGGGSTNRQTEGKQYERCNQSTRSQPMVGVPAMLLGLPVVWKRFRRPFCDSVVDGNRKR